jgi:hypothetical protein
MKTLKILILAISPLLFYACSEDKMDYINRELNNALSMSAQSEIPDVILKSSVQGTATDIAWYATVYIEQSAGTWAQSADADRRTGQTAASLFGNSWDQQYDVLMICKDIIAKTEPDGSEPDNQFARGIAKLFTAYNLAILTDMWGEVPWTEALLGASVLQPKFDNQSAIYPKIQQYLDEAITAFTAATNVSGVGDYIYHGDVDAWIRAANSLKARYYLRLSERDNTAAASALNVIANGLSEIGDNFEFGAYEVSASGENPWYQFLSDRTHLSASQTLFNLMNDRNDPRIAEYFTMVDTTASGTGVPVYHPAPSGTAIENQGGWYSTSRITENGQTAPTPLMTYHELKFIETEARFRTGDDTWQTSLQEAVAANFAYHGATGDSAYYADEVAPRLTAGNELNEILVQKYIGFYEFEAIEAYNDYRRVPAFLTLNNPNNITTGFVWRYPYGLSEVSSNPDNIPVINVFADKVWWAGGAELIQ